LSNKEKNMKKLLLTLCFAVSAMAFAKDPVDPNSATAKEAKQATEAPVKKETAKEAREAAAKEKAEKAEKAAKVKEEKAEKAAKLKEEKAEKAAKAKEEKAEKAAKAKENKETKVKEKVDTPVAEKKQEVKEATKQVESKTNNPAPVAKEPTKANLPKGSASAEGAAARAKIGELKPGPNDLDKNGKQLTSQQMKMKECSAMGKGRNQADFRAFMSECLKND
jgi:flagellar biosynthesis GTPase FlhF